MAQKKREIFKMEIKCWIKLRNGIDEIKKSLRRNIGQFDLTDFF